MVQQWSDESGFTHEPSPKVPKQVKPRREDGVLEHDDVED